MSVFLCVYVCVFVYVCLCLCVYVCVFVCLCVQFSACLPVFPSSYYIHLHVFPLVQSGFFSTNWLFIGKCYLKLNNKAEAKPWLQKTADYVSEDPDEKEVSLFIKQWSGTQFIH